MGSYVFKLPDIGEGTAEAEIVAWHVKVGDHVARTAARRRDDRQGDGGDVLAGARHGRRAARRAGRDGGGRRARWSCSTSRARATLQRPTRLQPHRAAARDGAPPAQTAAEPARAKPNRKRAKHRADRRRRVSPRARAGDEAAGVAGGAPARATNSASSCSSCRARARAGASAMTISTPMSHRRRRRGAVAQRYAQRDGVEEIKVIGLRRKIAEQHAGGQAPHPAFRLCRGDRRHGAGGAARASQRDQARRRSRKLTLLPFLMRALVKVAAATIRRSTRASTTRPAWCIAMRAVHIGVATQTADGLIVPVVRHAEALDLWDSARGDRARSPQRRARARRRATN